METNSHKQQLESGTYSLRVGNSVPQDGVNLAYIGNTKSNVTSGEVHITHNKEYKSTDALEEIMYVDEDYILRSKYQSDMIYSDKILITDVFTEDAEQVPLYYKYKLKELVDKTVSSPTTYTGSNIKIRKINGNLTSSQKYKIVLYPELDIQGTPTGLSEVYIYTNFMSDKDNTYQIFYPRHTESGEETNYMELPDLSPVFEEVDKVTPWPGQYAGQKYYATEIQEDLGYVVYVSSKGEKFINEARTPNAFQYKVDIKAESICNASNPKTLNVGIIEIKAYPGIPINGVINMLTGEGGLADKTIPSYLTLKNPHPYLMQTDNRSNIDWIDESFEEDRYSYRYWEADINMPLRHMYDYDILIITGYGQLTEDIFTNKHQDNFEKYLRHGGTVWIDNNGTEEQSLIGIVNSSSEPIFPIKFNFNLQEDAEDLVKSDYLNILSRYYDIDDIAGLVDDVYIELVDVDEQDIENLLVIGEGQNKLTICKYLDKGKLILSSTGILSGVTSADTASVETAINILLRMSELKWTTSGYLNSSILHKNALHDIDYSHDMLAQPYVNGYSNADPPSTVSLKRIIPNLFDAMQNYSSLQPNNIMEYKVSTNDSDIHISPQKTTYEPTDTVYVYANKPSQRLNLPADIKLEIEYPLMEFEYTIEAFTHEPGTNNAYEEYDQTSTLVHTSTVSAKDGIKDLGHLSTLLPGLRAGSQWVDKSLVYYKIRLGRYIDDSFIETANSKKVNLVIYDNAKERYHVSRDGYLILSSSDISNNMQIKVYTDSYSTIITSYLSVFTEPTSIRLREPADKYEAYPWHIRISNGTFSDKIATMRDKFGNSVIESIEEYYYKIPEYYNQPFMPPEQTSTKLRTFEVAKFIDSDLIQVSRVPIALDNQLKVFRRDSRRDTEGEILQYSDGFSFSSINTNWLVRPEPILRRRNGNQIHSSLYTINYEEGTVDFLNKTSDVFADYSYASDTELEVSSIDRNSGLVQLSNDIRYTDTILVTYYYNERYLVYTGYKDGDTFWHLDVNPAPGHLITYPTIEDEEVKPRDVDTYRLLGETVYVYMIPYKIGETYNNQTIRHVFSLDEWKAIRQAMPEAKLLGHVQVREDSTVDDLVLFDTRRRGGGLKESLNPANTSAEHYWDIGNWNGKAYQTQGVSVISIPKRALDAHVKQQTGTKDFKKAKDEIREIIQRHLAFGVFPIINYVDNDISSVEFKFAVRGVQSFFVHEAQTNEEISY